MNQLPNSWQIKRLDELCEIARGGSPRPIKQYITDAQNGINWIKIGDATASSKYIYKTKDKIKPEGVRRSRLVYEGDFLLSNSMSFGRPYIMKTSGCIHDGWLVLHDNSGVFDQDYLYYFLGSGSAFRQFDDRAAGSTVRNLNIGLVQSVQVPLPPLPEQHRIVTILDEAFEGIATATANAEKNLKNARELFESYLNAIFTQKGEGWNLMHLNDVCIEFGRGKSKHRPRNDPSLYGGPYPFIQTGDISNATHFIDTYTQTYSDLGVKQSKIWPKGTICLAIVGATIGETGILKFDACFPDSVIGMVPDPSKIKMGFLEYLLQYFKKAIKERGQGSARENINLGTFRDQRFPIPPISEQISIEIGIDRLFSETQRLESIYQKKLSTLAELKQSLLQKAFSGELTAESTATIQKEALA